MRRSLLVLCFVGLVYVVLTAQQPIFRSGVQYVAVDVVVTDKNDKPLADLRKEDFEIVEGGKAQKVADFQFISVPAVRASSLRTPQPSLSRTWQPMSRRSPTAACS